MDYSDRARDINEFVIISADRRENTPAENVAARVALNAGLKQLNYGFIPIDGVGQEANPGGVMEQQARSLRGELYSSIGAPASGPVDIDSI